MNEGCLAFPALIGQIGVQNDVPRLGALLQGNSGSLLAVSVGVAVVVFVFLGIDYYRDWKRKQRLRRWNQAASGRALS
jgi:hypothetical protein